MKKLIFKLGFYLLSFVLILFNCNQTYNDDYPGISIYKTNGDYFYLVDIGMKGDKIFRRDSYLTDRSKIEILGVDTIYKNRQKLANGYILDWEADERYDVFLNMSFKEHMRKEVECQSVCLSDDTLKNYILDRAPYKEFYREIGDTKKFTHPDTSELNKIIRDGKIEDYFKRLK